MASRRTGAEVLKAAIQNGQVFTPDVIIALGRPLHAAEHDLRSGITLGCLAIGFAVCGFVIRIGAVVAISETGAVERFSENSGGLFFIVAIIRGALAVGQFLSAFLRRGKRTCKVFSPLANDPDTDLFKAARCGEEVAFTQLVRRHQAMVRGFLRRFCGSATYPDDLAQETFVRAWRKINAFQGKAALRAWLCRIAYAQFPQSRRGELRRLARDTAALTETDMLGELRREAEARLDLDRAFAGLAPDQWAVVALCLGEGMSHTEAAGALEMPLGAVKSHALWGRQKVLEFFDSEAGT